MSFKNYKIPLDFSKIFETESADMDRKKSSHRLIRKTDSLKRSVDENIELLLSTRKGEFKSYRDYGFTLWDKEFENIEIEKFNTHNNPKQQYEEKFRKMIAKYEPRLNNVQVELLFIYKKTFKGKTIKFFVDLSVRGNLNNKLNEAYHNSFQFAMGPLLK